MCTHTSDMRIGSGEEVSPTDAQRGYLRGGDLGAVGSSGACSPGRGHSSAEPQGMGAFVMSTEGRGEACGGLGFYSQAPGGL